jgi:hypothetical protein
MNIEKEAEKYRLEQRKKFAKELHLAFKGTEQFLIQNLHNTDELERSLCRLEEAKHWAVACKERHGLR